MRTSTTASWNAAATSASGTGSPARSRVSTQRATAVFSPVKEKSNRWRSRSRGPVSPRGKSMDAGSPSRAARSMYGPTRERQAEHPGHLVERLPRGVVDGLPERLDVGRDVTDQQQRGVAPAHQQRQARLGQRPVLELVHRDVRGQVVDAVQRAVQRERQRLGRGVPHQQRAGQPGAGGHRDGVDVGEPHAGLGAGPLEHRDHGLQVGPAGHLGDHPAEPLVLGHAGGHRIGEQRRAADQADPGLVAGGLDAEHQRLVAHGILPLMTRRMTTASLPGP